MKKTMQLAAATLLLISFATQANVSFTLTNNSAQPIILIGYANNRILKLNPEAIRLQNIKTLKSDETLSMNIENGKLDLIINITGNNKKQYKYETSPTANNKDKILIWDGSQLYPASDKYNLMGIIKTKTPIGNNINTDELIQTE